ncbi:hypothetical protein MMC25_005868 [Agyrium rufum]|nr:hypothetical protein [Agyrium rufum]
MSGVILSGGGFAAFGATYGTKAARATFRDRPTSPNVPHNCSSVAGGNSSAFGAAAGGAHLNMTCLSEFSPTNGSNRTAKAANPHVFFNLDDAPDPANLDITAFDEGLFYDAGKKNVTTVNITETYFVDAASASSASLSASAFVPSSACPRFFSLSSNHLQVPTILTLTTGCITTVLCFVITILMKKPHLSARNANRRLLNDLRKAKKTARKEAKEAKKAAKEANRTDTAFWDTAPAPIPAMTATPYESEKAVTAADVSDEDLAVLKRLARRHLFAAAACLLLALLSTSFGAWAIWGQVKCVVLPGKLSWKVSLGLWVGVVVSQLLWTVRNVVCMWVQWRRMGSEAVDGER